MSDPLRQPAYSPAIFNVADEDAAKRIILTPERQITTDERWERETPYLTRLIRMALPTLGPKNRVIDYGCGIGRLSKELVERIGCRVTGVDISPSMRELAPGYVASDKFDVISPEELDHRILESEDRYDAAISIWVLQHCFHVENDVNRIAGALKPSGRLFVVNDRRRFVPTNMGWADDGKQLLELIGDQLNYIRLQKLDAEIMGSCGSSSFCATFSRAPF